MIGMLKYRADPSKNKAGEERMAEAQNALAVYNSLTVSDKRSFLRDFEASGKGRGRNFSFAMGYKKTISDVRSAETSTVEAFIV